MTAPLPKVSFRFEVAADPHPPWRVVHVRAREGLSELYTAVIDLANEGLTTDPDDLLGVEARLLLSREAHQRRLCGIVHRVEHIGTRAGHLMCRVYLAPALYALSQRRDCFIFQDVTADQALATVLATSFTPWQRTYRLENQRPLPTREYFVQYNESDLDFVLRLMAEEGLAFYFDHSGEREELVIVDANESFVAVTTMDGNPLTIQGPESGTATVERVRDFDLVHSLQSTSSVVRDFDWTHPRLDLTRPARGTDLRGLDREVYEYPGPLTIGEYSQPAYTDEDGRVQATLRREQWQSRVKRFVGRGYVTTFTPGQTFDLTGHGNHAFDDRYLLTRVEHEGHAPEELTSDTHTEEETLQERYTNRFECIPAAVTFRPPRDFARPRIYGVQTATVVGPSGEEIYTDEHGRIKVQFHWDREGARNQDSSCWVRVAQAWAGPGWGFSFIPRIGMEVIVTFLEGNPDRPLVTGSVYNGENRPPYEMPGPGAQTVSTLKTNSTPTSGGYNELRFEDKAGGEEIYLQAQKDFNELVKNNHSTHVKNCQTNTVDVDQTETIGRDQTLTVHRNRCKTIDGNESIHIKGQQNITIDGGGNGGDDPPPAPGAGLFVTGEYTVEATSKITLKVGGSTLVIDGTTITATAGGGSVLRLNDLAHMWSSGNAAILLTADALVTSNDGSGLFLDANANLGASTGATILLTADANVHADGGGDLTLTADAQLQSDGGAKLLLTADAALSGSGGGKVLLTSDAKVTGGTVKLNS